ncbi:hypothetical protein ACP70R_037472 [Stipagrostis hirtigluma subsp. patula]
MASPSSSLCSSFASPRAASLCCRHGLVFSYARWEVIPGEGISSQLISSQRVTSLCPLPFYLPTLPNLVIRFVKAVEVAGCAWIHVDVMDGRFVPNITIGPLIVDALRPVTDLPLDVQLMIVEPEQRVPDFMKAGVDIVSVQCEQSSTIHLHRTVNQVVDLVLIMSGVNTWIEVDGVDPKNATRNDG